MKHSKHGSAIAPEDDIDDRGVAAKQVVRVIGAAGMPPPPTSAHRSVFDAGLAAKPKRPHVRPPSAAEIAQVIVRSGVPVPPARGGRTPSVYAELAQRMKPGDMVELPERAARGFVAFLKKGGTRYLVRQLQPGVLGVWRQS